MNAVMLSYFENLAEGIEGKLRSGPQAFTARKKLALNIARLGIRLYSGKEPIAWCGVLAPFDLLHAMGITSCFVEFVGAMLASTGAVGPMLERAENAGYGTDGCSYHRSVLGAALQGLMPEPDFLIATSGPCTGGLATIENLARYFEKDLFVIHIPQRDDEKGVRYLADQFRSMVAFVATQTGRSLDPARLRDAMENTNRTRALMVSMNDLAARIPTPARRRDLVNFGIVMSLLVGTESAVEIAETYRDEFAGKVSRGIAGVAGERVRLLWLQNRIQFQNPLERMLEDEYRAAVVMDELNHITWDPIDLDNPYTGLARRALSIPLTGPAARRIDNLQQLARVYRVDGAINPCHWGCRQGTGARGLIYKGLREVGVPVLNLEVDCIDPRNFAEAQLRTRLQAFMEMLTEGR
jgi:benzoyl-CoA reductase/2-hydroxyglutaryl-CoA dehydratase subunit BcrC/BadD/HgdB